MASAGSSPTEDQLLCSICLDVFSDPVTIPCGHNFCSPCIGEYWDTSEAVCQCPLCKERFYVRPKLCVNTFISELAAQFRRSKAEAEGGERPRPDAPPGDVPCDVCAGATRRAAVKSCLVCLTSYCDAHLEPHRRKPALARHALIDPVAEPESRMCEKHHQAPLELFCKADGAFLCALCAEKDHRGHKTVTLEREYEERQAHLFTTKSEVHLRILDRLGKIDELADSVETGKKDAEKVLSDSVRAITALGLYLERSQAEVTEVIEEKQKRAERQVEGHIEELKEEVAELLQKSAELDRISHGEDRLHFLRSVPCLPVLPPQTKDWSKVGVRRDHLDAVANAVAQLERTVRREVKALCDPDLKLVRRHAADVTLDPDTAHPELVLSEDGKRVTHGNRRRNVPVGAQRFDQVPNVLAKDGFSSGRFYYEVRVADKTQWDLGVAHESINRKGDTRLSPKNGYWTVWLRKGDQLIANASPAVTLCPREKPQKVGVFVDYEEGEVSFYDAESRAHIYSFTRCTFTEKLYPFFSPGGNDGGKNSAPMIITPVESQE